MAVLACRTWVLALLLGLGAVPTAPAMPPALAEYRLKAAFLFNFVKFVEWPPRAFKTPDEPISLCVAGENPFGTSLLTITRDQTVSGRALEVREVSSLRRTSSCKVLFFSASERERAISWLPRLTESNILTVGDSEEFLADGSIICFRLIDSRVRFVISATAAARAELKISSKLLSLAEPPRGGR